MPCHPHHAQAPLSFHYLFRSHPVCCRYGPYQPPFRIYPRTCVLAAASTRIVVQAVQKGGDRWAARADGCGEVERDDWQRQFVSYSGDDNYCQGEVHGRSVHSSALDEIAPPWRMVPHGQPIGRCKWQLGGAAREAHSTAACSERKRFRYVHFGVQQQQQAAGAAGAAARLQWGGAARLRLKPTDVVLLSTVAPSAPTDLLCPRVLYRLAVLLAERNASGEDGDSDRCFQTRICTPEDSPVYQGLVGVVDGGECAGGASWGARKGWCKHNGGGGGEQVEAEDV
ncbi:unnamed protein product [Closterium sp. NIES-65]|nr:unnamed protein product [Closterium sp. NIES-65]